MRGLSFEETLSNLMHLRMLAKKHNPEFMLVMVFCAMRRNIEQLSDYVDLARRVGARVIQVNYLQVANEKHGLDHESMLFHKDLYDYHVITAMKKAASYGIALQHQPLFSTYEEEHCAELPPCYKPWEHLNVNQQGDVTICCGGAGSLGNIFKQDFFEVWNSKPFRTFRRLVNSDNPPENCRKCTRGRENPHAVTTHLTYLKSLPEDERRERISEIEATLG
ncbi:radical SAM/SPASM domain-containing protein [Salidesulfovibrio brasiliensis]|uniref:radical SAM/SPASM domain-containing protein n=1 Tax=Salidesulfovibrio brasiliensis TaxID=221711 RepID=UPI0006CF2347|nr:radical SAM/SPASM domain-containing protein [Salidesulfovibrio brasiliensis]